MLSVHELNISNWASYQTYVATREREGLLLKVARGMQRDAGPPGAQRTDRAVAASQPRAGGGGGGGGQGGGGLSERRGAGKCQVGGQRRAVRRWRETEQRAELQQMGTGRVFC